MFNCWNLGGKQTGCHERTVAIGPQAEITAEFLDDRLRSETPAGHGLKALVAFSSQDFYLLRGAGFLSAVLDAPLGGGAAVSLAFSTNSPTASAFSACFLGPIP
jgi:hypothetical protein